MLHLLALLPLGPSSGRWQISLRKSSEIVSPQKLLIYFAGGTGGLGQKDSNFPGNRPKKVPKMAQIAQNYLTRKIIELCDCKQRHQEKGFVEGGKGGAINAFKVRKGENKRQAKQNSKGQKLIRTHTK